MKKNENNYGRLKTFILSLIIAIAIWVMVGIVNDPDVRNTIASLPVSYIGTEELKERGLIIIAPEEKNTAAVVVSGKRGDLIRYGKDIYISADVSGITSPGEYKIKGAAQLSDTRISLIRERVGEIDIRVEKLAEKEVPVTVKQTGSLKNNIIKSVPQLDKIVISGAESEVEAVKTAEVSIDISKISEDSVTYSEFKLLDESGAALTKAVTLSAQSDKIAIDNTVYNKKTLPVELMLSAEFETKYYLDKANSSINPSSVEVGVLDSCKADKVYADIDKTSEESADFELIETEGMYIPEGSSTVKVKPSLLPVISQHMDINVRAENLGEGLNAEYTDHLTGVLVSAPEEILSSSDMKLVIDLGDLSKGEHKVKAKMSDERIVVSEEIYIDVIIN